MPPESPISLEIDIPDDLHQRIKLFLEANPAWHYDDFVCSALSLLLLQLGDSENRDVRHYLDRMYYKLWGEEVA